MKNNILVFSAHPDDEILGLGGTLRKHIEKGESVRVIILCEAETMRYKNKNVNLKEMASKSAKIMGFEEIIFLDFPDQGLDKFSLVEVIKPIEDYLSKYNPDIVYTHFIGDINKDHKIIAEATIVATRPFKNKIKYLIGYDNPSSTEWEIPYRFSPNYFVNVKDTFKKKIEALKCYVSEINPFPHPRSEEAILARAKYWGSFCNMELAEAFYIYRILWD